MIWLMRNITLIDKTLIIKSLIMSHIIDIALVIPDPPDEVERTIFSYVWDKKSDKFKRKYLIAPKNEGGLYT